MLKNHSQLLIALFLGFGVVQSTHAGYIFSSSETSYRTKNSYPGLVGGRHVQAFHPTQSNFNEDFIHIYNGDKFEIRTNIEPPIDPYKAQTSNLSTQDVEYRDGENTRLTTVEAYSSVDARSAEIKLLSSSFAKRPNDPFLGTYAEGAQSVGAIKGEIFFKSDTHFTFDFTLNLEGLLTGTSSLQTEFKNQKHGWNHPQNVNHVYYSSLASCGPDIFLKTTYSCHESAISKSMTFKIDSERDMLYGQMPDGTSGLVFSFFYKLTAKAWETDGKAAFNNSSWININVPNNVQWFTESGQLLSNQRANIGSPVQQVSAPATISFLLAGCFMLIFLTSTISRRTPIH